MTDMEADGLVAVRIGPQLCGIPVGRVHDILRQMPITPVPLAPAGVAGSMNLRGRIVTAIDVGARLAVAAETPPAARMSVVIASGEDRYALLVDDVADVVDRDARTPAHAQAVSLDAHWSACAAGLCRLTDASEAAAADALIVVLDVDRILTIAEGN